MRDTSITACNLNFPALTKLNVSLFLHFTITDLNKLGQSETALRKSTSSHWHRLRGFAWWHLGLFLDDCTPMRDAELRSEAPRCDRGCVKQIMEWCAFNFKEAKWYGRAGEVKSCRGNVYQSTHGRFGVSSSVLTSPAALLPRQNTHMQCSSLRIQASFNLF